MVIGYCGRFPYMGFIIWWSKSRNPTSGASVLIYSPYYHVVSHALILHPDDSWSHRVMTKYGRRAFGMTHGIGIVLRESYCPYDVSALAPCVFRVHKRSPSLLLFRFQTSSIHLGSRL